MSKKIIEQSNLNIKDISLRKQKNSKSILPSIDFIFLCEEQKENSFGLSNIGYIRNNDDIIIKNNNCLFNNNSNFIKINNVNNIKLNIYNNIIQNYSYNQTYDINIENIDSKKSFQNFNPNQSVNIQKYEVNTLENIFCVDNSVLLRMDS